MPDGAVVDDGIGSHGLKEAAQMEFALKAGHLGSWILDLATMDLQASDICKQIFGQPLDRPFAYSTLVDSIHPDDRAYQQQAVQRTVQTGADYDVEYRVVFPDSTIRWVNIRGQLRYNEHKLAEAMVGISLDITDRKNAEQQLSESREELATALEQVRLSKEAAELGTFDMDLKNGTLHWDKRCRLLFGITHSDAITYQKDFVSGLHPDDRDRILMVIDKTFIKAQSQGEYDVEYRTIGAEDGVERWVKAKGKAYFDAQDVPVRFIGSVLDITPQMTALQRIESTVTERTQELAAANERLQVINRELIRSNQHLEEFAHAASHDLKEPIRKIRFFVDHLIGQLRGVALEAAQESFARIQRATQRMGDLIDDLLLYSHVSQKPLEREPVDLQEKVQRVLEDLELSIDDRRAIIHVGTLPVVHGYSRQLQQLLQNLISNAVKYSRPDHAPEVTITATSEEVMGIRHQVICIQDKGIGFEQKFADQIFNMFARLHAKTEYSGTGVGLAIVRKVVENHNGFIRVKSAPGQGALFQIFLPD